MVGKHGWATDISECSVGNELKIEGMVMSLRSEKDGKMGMVRVNEIDMMISNIIQSF